MSKLWKKYNFVIILLILSYLFAFILVIKHDEVDLDDYISISIKHGDTLWDIANKYAEHSNMYHEQFIAWVENKNGIMRNDIEAGTSLLIPVKTEKYKQKTVATSQ